MWLECRFLDTEFDGSNLGISICALEQDTIRIASVDSAEKLVPGWGNLVKGVQCHELYVGIALKSNAFSNTMP